VATPPRRYMQSVVSLLGNGPLFLDLYLLSAFSARRGTSLFQGFCGDVCSCRRFLMVASRYSVILGLPFSARLSVQIDPFFSVVEKDGAHCHHWFFFRTLSFTSIVLTTILVPSSVHGLKCWLKVILSVFQLAPHPQKHSISGSSFSHSVKVS